MPRPRAAVAGGAIALLFPVLVSPSVAIPAVSVRHAALSIVAAAGVVALGAMIRTDSRRVALLALAFVAWSGVAALTAVNRGTAFWGQFSWGTGWLFVLAVVGAWAIGCTGGARGRHLIERGLVVSLMANAVVCFLQLALKLDAYGLPLKDNRATGLFGNPVFVAAFLAGGIWLVGARFPGRPLRGSLMAVALAGALQATGSRFAVALVVVGLLLLPLRIGLRPGGAFAALVVVGLVLGALLASHAGTPSGSQRAVAGEASGLAPRVENWLSAGHAVAHRPLVGTGPNGFRDATSPRRTAKLVRTEGPGHIFLDAHNIVVEYAVTTGLVGVLLFLVWIALCLRRCDWSAPLSGFALILFLMHLVEPQDVGLTPVLFLALGAASAARLPEPDVVPLGARIALLVAGTVTAIVLLVGSWELRQGALDFDLAHTNAAIRLLPPFAAPLVVKARIYTFRAKMEHNPALLVTARYWARRAVAREPNDSNLWQNLANLELGAGLASRAEHDFREALRQNPYELGAMVGLGRIALSSGRPLEASAWFQRVLTFDPSQRDVRTLLDEARRATSR